MRSTAERHLVILTIVVSLALTGVTVWAVAEQGWALQARELADLRNSAATASAHRQAALVADVERAFDAAGRAWDIDGTDGVDAWAASQRDWFLACCATAGGPWTACPRTPLEVPLPGSPDSEVRGYDSVPDPDEEQPATGGRDLLKTLDSFRQTAMSPDPLTRAGALLAMAACEQQLGHPLAAARIFADAAHLLRSTPHLTRFAFRAELARIDSLLAAGDRDRAREAFASFLNGVLSDHPARLGPTEAARLQHQAENLGITDDDPPAAMLARLQDRADRRRSVTDAVERLLRAGGAERRARTDRIEFLNGMTASNEPIVVAVRQIADRTRLVLVSPTTDLLTRYWGSRADGVLWQVRLPEERSGQILLAELGPEFGGAVVEPSPAAATALKAAARRHLAIVLATATGTAGAWALVIWMMIRVVARQRALARLQGRFVADVSHELKTPLALIRLLSETLADRRVRDPERIEAYHGAIARESERLTVLLDNILDLGRIESGRKRYEFGECDVAETARQAWTLFEPRFADEGFDARLEIAADLPTIRADPQALQQVIVNLLQNAHRYAGDGKYVRLAVAREGYVILITVEDHGIGMKRSQLNRLGESFFRADDTRVRQTRGTGLGLAIAHHVVTAHRGKIEVQSHPGQGSKFTVWIPFERPGDE